MKRLIPGKAHNWAIATISLVILILCFLGIHYILQDTTTCQSCAIYKAIGYGIIIIWSGIFIIYFIWASYFYNVNYGITDKEWHKIEDAKKNRASGIYYNPEDINDEPLYNPYSDQTFGLPTGTVRGMIAFTLLFGAISLVVVSFGMSDEIAPGSLLRDQFEFFKTAFLMMIAFYFGDRSLKYLKNKDTVSPVNTRGTATVTARETAAPELASKQERPKPKDTIVVIDSGNPAGESTSSSEGIPPIVAVDPMAITSAGTNQ